jgi:hypothetical protein
MSASYKIVAARHVTARQREIIQWMVDNHSMTAGTRTIYASMEKMEGNRYKVTFKKRETNDYGKPIVRLSFAEIEILESR